MRKTIKLICLLIVVPLAWCDEIPEEFQSIFAQTNPKVSSSAQAAAAQALIARTVPDHAHLFKVTITTSTLQSHSFQLLSKNDGGNQTIVHITATSGVIACKAFYHYLKNYCNSHISWDGQRIRMPDTLPRVDKIETSASRFIYYQNVCTWSYSFAWWQFKDWQRHIDWIAMQGITLTLAPVQELVWQRVYTELGLNQMEIDEHFTGPAFFAWQRMGNMRGFAGPLSNRFMLWSSSLQKQMIAMLQDLGISFALPAFAGHVPRAFKRIYPNTSYSAAVRWNNFPNEFCCPLFIDPLDPLFKTVGKLFLTKIIEEYGNGNHIYFSDPFNEMRPTNLSRSYIEAVSKMIYSTMAEVDRNAIWLLQGWFFLDNIWTNELKQAFLTAVPSGRILVLDLHAEIHPQYDRSKSFYGQPFIWCMLHNFGGTLGMQGMLNAVNEGIVKAKKFSDSTMVGVGITPEGINQNYVMYEFALDRAWYQNLTDVPTWIATYASNRYGIEDVHLQNAWKILRDTVFKYVGDSNHGQYLICRRPSINFITSTWYNLTLIDDVLENFLQVPANSTIDNVLYKHDLIDVTRQFVQNKIEILYPRIKQAFMAKNLNEFQTIRSKFQSIYADLDDLLHGDEQFMLGKWLESAKSLATSPTERKQYEYNARNQVTIWGPRGEIVDYSYKQWSGLIRDYCLPRWQLFFSDLESAMRANGTFNESKFKQNVFKQVEEPFTFANKEYSAVAHGAPIEIARNIWQKWKGIK